MATFRDRGARRENDLRINHRIRVPEVRLIGHTGEQLGVVATPQALQMARDVGLDLVEVAATASPPVCKILDYGKFKYEQKKKAHEAKKKQVIVKTKEVKMRPHTEDHDLDFKIRHVKRFLEEGDKAKICIQFKGREMAFTDQGRTLMNRIMEMLKDQCKVEQSPIMEGRTMIMIVAPGP